MAGDGPPDGRRGSVRPGRAVVSLGAALSIVLVAIAALTSSASPSPAARGALSNPPGGGNPSVPAASSGVGTARSFPASAVPGTASGVLPPGAAVAVPGRFPGGLLVADRGNGRLLVVTASKHVAWSFPGPGGMPHGQHFSADDAFVSPDGRTIVANDEAHEVIDRIDIATRRVVWQYGAYDEPGSGPGHLHTPDDAYPLANGDIVVADIRNCRILEIAPSKKIVRQWGHAGQCSDHPPTAFDNPNGDTPLPDGGLLITQITESRIVRLRPDGRVAFDIHAPVVYPSDAQLTGDGSIVVADYTSPGAIVRLAASGRVVWRYLVRHGLGRLDHPSLAVPLPDGTIAANDDLRDRVVVIDPRTNRIVWQYGTTDHPGRAAGHLSMPDGIEVLPPGTIPGLG
jgi:outer membrane protein assembly factor BamB